MPVLFDLDGTILGARKDKSKVRNECAKKLNLPEISREDYYKAFQETIDNSKVDTRIPIFERVLGDRELAERVAKEYRKKSLENAYVYPDAKEVLQELSVRKGLVSNGPRIVQREKIREFDLEKYFDFIAISGELGVSKPGKEIFQIALESLDSTPEETLYVGDVPETDIVGARNAGVISILVLRENESSIKHDPDYKIKDLRGLQNILDKREITR